MTKTPAFLLALLCATPAFAFEGRYAGTAPGQKQSLTIQPHIQGFVELVFATKTKGCKGEVRIGTPRPAGDHFVTQGGDSGSARNGDEVKGACVLDIRKTAEGVSVSERACTDFHGPACGFGGNYRLAGADGTISNAAGGSTAAGQGVNFYCIDEHRIDNAHKGDPNYRIKPDPAGTDLHSVMMGVEYAFHDGVFIHSYAGNSHFTRGVSGRRVGNAVQYRGSRGERWTVTPAGGVKVAVTGTGVKEPPAMGYACSWR